MKNLSTLLKIAATAALFWFVFSRVDVGELAAKLTPRQIIVALVAGAVVVSLQAFVAAHRLRLCARLMGHEIKTLGTWVACQYGGLFSHTPISFVGGDAVRIWHLVKLGLPLPDSAKTVVVDRALGFMGMMTLVIATSPLLSSVITDAGMWAGYVLLVAIGAAAVVTFFVLGRLRPISTRFRVLRWIVEFATVSRYLAAHPALAAQAFAVAFVVTCFNVIAIWTIGLGYSAETGLVTTFAAAPVVFLISMIPISVAGWGLREGAFVVAFGLFGIPAADSLTVSITFGVAVLLAYSPAAVLLVLARRDASDSTKSAGYAPASELPRERS